MRFTRLKKNIDASTSFSTASSLRNGKSGSTVQGATNTNAKKRKIEKQIDSADQKIAAGSKVKSESLESEFIRPSSPVKRQTRGKKIDISAALESDTSPSPGAQLQQGDDNSDYENGQETGDKEDQFGDNFDSETGHQAKRRRSSSSKREMNQSSPNSKTSFNNGSPFVLESDLSEPISTSAAATPPSNGADPGVLPNSLSPMHRANDHGSTSFGPVSTSKRIMLQTPTQPLMNPASTRPTQFTAGYPTPGNSNNNNNSSSSSSTAFQTPFASPTLSDIMPSIEHDASDDDDGSVATSMDSTTAVTGSSMNAESETQVNNRRRTPTFTSHQQHISTLQPCF